MAQTMTIEQAQAYLLENTYGKLRALIHDPFYGTRNACIIYDGDLELALNRQGRFYRRDIKVLEDREITDYVINDQRTILKRG